MLTIDDAVTEAFSTRHNGIANVSGTRQCVFVQEPTGRPVTTPWSQRMKRQREPRVIDREARPGYPWVEAARRAKDPNAFLMGLGETEFAVLLAELDARRLPMVTTGAPGRNRWNARLGAAER